MRAQVAQSPSPHRREADDPGPRSRTAEEREPRASDADGRGPRTRTIEDRTPHTRDPHTRTAEDGVPLRGGSDGHGVRIRLVLGAGAGLSGIGLVTVAVSEELWALLLGFSLLGGVGGGLVYGVCSRLVAGWYPERSAARVGYVTGAFGYGALPLAVVAGATAAGGDGPWAVQVAFAVCAVVAVVAIGLAARFVRLAPRRWWPATVDPRKHALDATQLRRTPPAVREFTPGQALRTPALAVLVGILLCAGTISIFDVVMVAALGEWPALALLIALNGAGRSGAMRVSEVLGRRRTLALVLAVLGVGQVVLASGSIMGGAVVAGLGGGAFYPLVAALVREYFGEERVSEIHGVVYSAKALAGIAGVGLAGVILAGSALLGGTGTHGGSPSPGGNSVIGGGGPVRGTVLIPDLLSGVGHLGGAGLGGIGLLAGCVAFGAAAASLRLRVPGRPVTIPV
ncbi:MFS transporter [Nonomuraea africana]|uniref:MFS transporter n=1 Tax=Nonomuraea africana TaxID=46171 RepID=UPI0033C3EF33